VVVAEEEEVVVVEVGVVEEVEQAVAVRLPPGPPRRRCGAPAICRPPA
jgi:hypothetical protein